MKKSGSNNGEKESYAPLLDDDSTRHTNDLDEMPKHTLFKKNPYEVSWLISKIFFSWVTPLARVSN